MSSERIVLLGVNHKTTPLAVREKLALAEGYEQPLQDLRAVSSIGEVYLLSTCNRVEVLFTCKDEHQASAEVMDLLFAGAVNEEDRQRYVYTYVNEEAVEHLFMVASSLDSMIVGEAQILGQLKEAYRYAADHKSTGVLLNKLLHKSFSVAKRVRTETRIGANAVSISYAAVELARKIFGDLRSKKILLIGAGEMAELAAEHLAGQVDTQVIVANRTLQRAVNLARCFNGHAIGLDEVTSQLQHVDIIISSTGAPNLVLEKKDVQPVMRGRRNRPLFFIDIAVPRDLDPELNKLDNVYLYDIDDLKHVVEMNKEERDKEAISATRIVAEEKMKFLQWMDSIAAKPTIIDLRSQVEALVMAEYERSASKLQSLSAGEKKAIETMIHSIAGKILHHPIQYLKDEHHCIPQPDRIATIRSLFQLDQAKQ